MAAESSSQDFREKIWGSNAMNKFDSMVCLTRFLLPPELFPKKSCSQSRVAEISRKPGKSLTTSAVFDNLSKLSDDFTGLLNGSHLLLWVGVACEHLCKVPKIYCWWLRNPIPNHRKDVEKNPVDNEIFTIYQQYLPLSRDPWPMLYLSRSSLPRKFWLGFNCDLERFWLGGMPWKNLDKPDETWDILHMKPCKKVW